MESLAEIFRCYICMEKLRNAHMCPHCSKLCCHSCIRRWFDTKTQCPYCRSTLHIEEMVNCRWAEEVTQQLDYLQQKEPTKKQKSAVSSLEAPVVAEKCATHGKEELSVYCSTCKCCICHECALWSSAHSGHAFKQLDDIYAERCTEIKEQVMLLRRKLMEIISSTQDVEKNIESVRTAKDQRVREIRNAVELMIARLDAHLKTKLMTLVNQKGHLTRRSDELENLLRDIESQLSSGNKSDLIKNTSKLIQTVQDALHKCAFAFGPVVVDFISELVPSYDASVYDVPKFSSLRAKADPFYSEPLKINGLVWRLKVYPDGNGAVRGSYLSVFLELTCGPPEPAKYEYRIEMIHLTSREPSKNMVREFASDFEIGECWGYNRFFRLDLLESEGFWNPESDIVKFRFDVRPPTFFQKCKDQQWYISQLQDSLKKQVAQYARVDEQLRSWLTPKTAQDDPTCDQVVPSPRGSSGFNTSFCEDDISNMPPTQVSSPNGNLSNAEKNLEENAEGHDENFGDNQEQELSRNDTASQGSDEKDIDTLDVVTSSEAPFLFACTP